MAKRRRAAATGTRIVHVGAARPAAPIIRINTPRAPAKRRGRGRRRSSSSSMGLGGIASGGIVPAAIGGALFGFVVKSGYVDRLPAIPVIGRTGTAALLLNYFSKHGGGQMARNAALAAAVLAGYQLGHDGKITGDELSGLTTTGDSFATAGDEEQHSS